MPHVSEIILSLPEAKGRNKVSNATRKYSFGLSSTMFCLVTECSLVCLAWPAICFKKSSSPRANPSALNQLIVSFDTSMIWAEGGRTMLKC